MSYQKKNLIFRVVEVIENFQKIYLYIVALSNILVLCINNLYFKQLYITLKYLKYNYHDLTYFSDVIFFVQQFLIYIKKIKTIGFNNSFRAIYLFLEIIYSFLEFLATFCGKYNKS